MTKRKYISQYGYLTQKMKPIQETLALDVLVDKLLKQNVPIQNIINAANICFSTRNPINQDYINTRLQKIAKYQEQLGKLLRLPKIEQRSQEWHDLRKGIVTASEFAQALNKAKFGTQKDFYKKKCGHDEIPFDPGCPPLKWGTMYEDVAIEIYKQRFGYDIHEFGILQHPTIKHFGASPDGINDFGIMVEIKCPFMRKITGEVPQQYYYQIQGQLSTCELYECDYVECELDEYGDIETWMEVGKEEKGIVIERKSHDPLNPWIYEYSPVFHTREGADKIMENATAFLAASIKDDEDVVLHFWTLRVFNNVRVYRDDDFIQDRFVELEPIWHKVLEYRQDVESYKTDITPPRKTRATAATTNQSQPDSPPKTNLSHAPSAPPAVLKGYSFLEDD